MRYIVVNIPGSLNESGVGISIVVDTDPEVAKIAVARCVDGPGAVTIATALNEAST